MAQTQIQAGGGSPDDSEGIGSLGGQTQVNVPQIDALLDQIDTVLETDAQSFVEGFVQKGGE